MLSLALGDVDHVRSKHTIAIAKSMVGSVKKIDLKFRILCQAVNRMGHLITMEPKGFIKSLKPMLTALAPLMDQDTSTWNFEDPEFLASLQCEPAFFETARLLMLENQVLEPDGQLDSSNFHCAMMLTSIWAQELLLAYCPAYLDVFSDWKDLSQLVQPNVIPRDLTVAMQTYCAQMVVETSKFYGTEVDGKFPLLFFQFPFYLSLGNVAGASRVAIKMLKDLRDTNPEDEISPTTKVIYPMFLLSSFFLENGDLNHGLEAYQVVSSFADRYTTAQRALVQLESKLELLYPTILASLLLPSQRKRGLIFLEETDSTLSMETQQPAESTLREFLASPNPSTATETTPNFSAEEAEAGVEEAPFLSASWNSGSNELSSTSPDDDEFWSLLRRDPKEEERLAHFAHFELDFAL